MFEKNDIPKIIEFLSKFHGKDKFTLNTLEDNSTPLARTFSFTDRSTAEEGISSFLTLNGANQNIVFSPNPVRDFIHKKATKTDIECVSWLYADIDPTKLVDINDNEKLNEHIENERKRLKKLVDSPALPYGIPEPTVRIASGNGYHLYWKLRESIPVTSVNVRDNIELHLYEIATVLGGDRGTWNIDRTLRLPWTTNHPSKSKRDQGFVASPCLLEVADFDKVYDLSDFPKAEQRPRNYFEELNIEYDSSYKVNDLSHLPEFLQKVIRGGGESMPPTIGPRNDRSRSGWVFYTLCQLIRLGIPEKDIVSIFMDPSYGISDSIREKKGRELKKLERDMRKAYEVLEGTKSLTDDSMRSVVEEMNRRYAIVKNTGGGVTEIVEFIPDDMQKRHLPNFVTYSRSSLSLYFMNQKVWVPTGKKEGDTKPAPLLDSWLSHPSVRKHEGFVFNPGFSDQVVDNMINLWQGFDCTPEKGDCSLFLKHIRDVLCEDEEQYEYLLNWIARMFQKPEEIGEVAVILQGKKGTGKTIFTNMLCDILGPHAKKDNQGRTLKGKFNSSLQDAVLVVADEADFGRTKWEDNILKGLITDHCMWIEPKGTDKFPIESRLHIIITSNEEGVVNVTDDERRYFCLKSSSKHMKDRSYFAMLLHQWGKGGREAFLYDMLSRDISDFVPTAVPETRHLEDQRLRSHDFYHRWYLDALVDEKLISAAGEGWTAPVVYDQLLEAIRPYTERYGNDSDRLTKKGVGIFLRKITNDKVAIVRTATGKEIRMPDLETCQEIWEDKYGSINEVQPQEITNDIDVSDAIPF